MLLYKDIAGFKAPRFKAQCRVPKILQRKIDWLMKSDGMESILFPSNNPV